MSFIVRFTCFNAFVIANEGVVVNHSGFWEASAYEMIFANGFKLYFSTASFDANRMAAAPSFRLLAFAAVIVPFFY